MEEEIIIIEPDVEQEIVIIENDIEYIEPTTQEKTIEPKKEQQIVVPDDGVFALSKVMVKKIPDEYVEVGGTIDIFQNGEYDVKSYEKANVNVGGASKGLIIKEYDNDGYPTKAEIVGMTAIPAYYLYIFTSTTKPVLGKLTSLKIPNDVTSIGQNAFYNNAYLPTMDLPNTLTSIGNNAFYQCTKLALTELPESITSIGNYAFQNCSNLALTKLPSNLTKIGQSTFYACTKLALTELPDGITTIDSSAFYKCNGINLTMLPSNLKTIGNSAFGSCTSIIELEIPSTVTSIGSSAFEYCSHLEKVVINRTTPPTLGTAVFSGTSIRSGNGYIYVPDESVETYRTATNWTTWASYIKGISELPVE